MQPDSLPRPRSTSSSGIRPWRNPEVKSFNDYQCFGTFRNVRLQWMIDVCFSGRRIGPGHQHSGQLGPFGRFQKCWWDQHRQMGMEEDPVSWLHLNRMNEMIKIGLQGTEWTGLLSIQRQSSGQHRCIDHRQLRLTDDSLERCGMEVSFSSLNLNLLD